MDTKNFDVIYEKLYENVGKEVEAKITKKRNNLIKILIILILLIVIAYIVGDIEILGLCIITGCLVFIFFLFKIEELKLRMYREDIIKNLVKFCNMNLNYDYNSGIKEIDYISSNIPGKYDVFQSKDYIYGKIQKNINLEISYINTYKKEKHIEDGKEVIEKIETFKGVFGIVNINKNINAEVIIDLNDFKRKYNLNKVEVDSIEFEKSFDCFSDNKIVALQVLTPNVLEQINKLCETFKKTMQIRISNNKIFYRIYLDDIFLPHRFKKILEKNRLKMIYELIYNSEMLIESIFESINESF